MKKLVLILVVLAMTLSACNTAPKITEGRIVDKYVDVQVDYIGNPQFNTPEYQYPTTTFINVQHYIIIKDKEVKQKVKVTPDEYEGLQIGWLVDCSKKFK